MAARADSGGVVTVRGTPKRRMFWRDIHAVTGLFAGFFIVFLAVTGMPWSVVWGKNVNEWANGSNFGYPAGVRVAVPMSDEHLAHMPARPPGRWSRPACRSPVAASAGGGPIGLDAAVADLRPAGTGRGLRRDLPGGPTGVYTGSVYPDDLSQQRVVHLDQYTGKPLIDMSFADYGPLGKGLEWGINVHMGQEFGLANQLFMLAVCAAIVLMSVSAGVMWWKRRPRGGFGVPPAPSDRRVLRGVVGILAVGGVVFPLVGASLLVMLALDTALTRRKA